MEHKKFTWKHYTLIAVGIVFVIYCCIAVYFSKKFTYGTKINGVDVSNKTVDEVTDIFKKKADGYSLTVKERKGREEVLKSSVLKVSFDGEDQIRKLKDGQSSFLWIKGVFGGEKYKDIDMFAYDKAAFQKALKNLDCFKKKNIIKIRNAKPVYKDGAYQIQKEEIGTVLKKEKTEKLIESAVEGGVAVVDLDKEGAYDVPKYTSKSKEIISLKDRMNDSLKGSITYKFGKQTVVLDKDVYHKWFKIKNDTDFTVDMKKMENWVMKFAYKYNTMGTMRTVKTHDGRTKKIFGGPYGWRMSREKEEAAVKKMLKEGTTETREPYWRQKAKVYDGYQGDIGDTYIEVDMGQQEVFYIKKKKIVFSSSVVTGKMEAGRKTPECVAFVLYKQRNATLSGQGYNSPVSYWMPFNGNVGLHDASWRSSFGGSEYISGGSHGCVNMPPYAAASLYNMIDAGTPVICYY